LTPAQSVPFIEQLSSRLELDDIETRKPLNQPYDLNQYVTAFEG
jgi:hypothetical protein